MRPFKEEFEISKCNRLNKNGETLPEDFYNAIINSTIKAPCGGKFLQGSWYMLDEDGNTIEFRFDGINWSRSHSGKRLIIIDDSFLEQCITQCLIEAVFNDTGICIYQKIAFSGDIWFNDDGNIIGFTGFGY